MKRYSLLFSFIFLMGGFSFFAISAGKKPADEKRKEYPKIYNIIPAEIDYGKKMGDGRYYLKLDSIPAKAFSIENGKIIFNNTIK